MKHRVNEELKLLANSERVQRTALYRNVQTLRPNSALTNLAAPHSEKHLPASLSTASLQSKTVKRCQCRTAYPLVHVDISHLLSCYSDLWRTPPQKGIAKQPTVKEKESK